MAKVTSSTFMCSAANAKSTVKELLETAISETRNLTSTEMNRLNTYFEFCSSEDKEHFRSIINEMNQSNIFNVELREQQPKENQIRKEEKRMNNTEFLNELRKNKELDLNVLSEETRAVGTQYAPASGNSRITVPENLVAGIILEAQNTNEIFKRARMILTSQDTKLNVGGFGDTQMQQLAELAEIQMKDFATSQVEVVLSRYGHGTRLSNRLIKASNFDVLQHARILFGDVLGRKEEDLAIAALEAAVTANKIQKVEVADTATARLKGVVQAILKLKPVYRTNAVIIASPSFYESMMLAEDSNGRNLLTFEMTSIRATLMGVPVLVSDGLTGSVCYVVDVQRALVACLNVAEVKAVDMPNVDAVDLFLNCYLGVGVQLPAAAVKVAVKVQG